MDENELISTVQAAEMLRIGRDTVRRACASGALPAVRVGSSYVIKRIDALRWKVSHYRPQMIRRHRRTRRR